MKTKTVYTLSIILILVTQYGFGQMKGFGSYNFNSGSKNITIWHNIPQSLHSNTDIVFVMHGVKRNGKDYCASWTEFSNRKNFILIVPEFSAANFPGSSQYNLANIIDSSGNYSKKENWHFHIIEDIFIDLKKKLNLNTKDYYLYGHSAGAQFVHRFVLFYPESSLKLAISANAGWYTFPDNSIDFPYGLNGVNLSVEQLKQAFSKRMIVLLGEKDTDTNHKHLRKTPEAETQGKNRLERGNNFFRSAQKMASQNNLPLNWEAKYVDGIGHSNSGMAKKAISFIE